MSTPSVLSTFTPFPWLPKSLLSRFCQQFFYFFHFYLFSFYWSVRDRCHTLIHSLSAPSNQDWALGSHTVSRDAGSWIITCCLAGNTTVGMLAQKQGAELEPGGSLTAASNTCPNQHLFLTSYIHLLLAPTCLIAPSSPFLNDATPLFPKKLQEKKGKTSVQKHSNIHPFMPIHILGTFCVKHFAWFVTAYKKKKPK